MVMDIAKTHNSTPPPGGGWVDAEEDEGSGSRRETCRNRGRRTRTPTNTEELVPPDGGWGWVIVLANCINTGVLVSILPCYGVMYSPLMALGYTNAQVALIPSMFNGITNFLGPMATGLSRYYTARRLSLAGVTIIVLGILFCSFYKNIIWYYVCFGAVAGLGNALVRPQGFLLGQKYFTQKRATANGLSTVGGSLGSMFLPPLMGYLLVNFGIEGSFMLWSGIVLHGMIGALLYHPVSWHLRPKKTTTLDPTSVKQNGSHPKDNIPGSKVVVAGKLEDHQECDVFKDESAVKNLTPDKDESDDSDHEELIITDDVALNTPNQGGGVCDDQGSERQWKNPLTDVMQTNEYLERPRTVSIERSMEILPQIPEESEDDDCFEAYDPESGNERIEFLNHENEMRNRPISYISAKSVDSIAKIPSVESIYDSHDVMNEFGSALSFKVEKLKDNARAAALEKKKHRRSSSIGQQTIRPYIIFGIKLPRLQHLINFSILRHPVFVIAASSSICNRFVYMCLMTYLPSFGQSIGIGRKAPYLITILTSFELLGKVIMSVVSDQGWLQRRYIHIMACSTMGVSLLCLTFSWDIVSLGACCALFGLCIGTAMSVGPILLVEYLGLKLLPHTFGMMLFLNGITGFTLMPLTGLLNDISGSFVISFYVIAFMAMLPGFLWSLVPCFPQAKGDSSKTPDNV